MHKGVILLVKATSREEAIGKVDEFMEPYGDGDIWDWYTIGGRWHNELAPSGKLKEFEDWVHETYKEAFSNIGYSINALENEEVRPVIQAKWESLGLKGKNTYYSGYGFEVSDSSDDYNVLPLSRCIKTVRKWKRDVEKEKAAAWNKMIEAKEKYKNGEDKWDGSGYYAGIYQDWDYGSFCFENNVYNVEEGIAENIPEDTKGYYAVMVDMHN